MLGDEPTNHLDFPTSLHDASDVGSELCGAYDKDNFSLGYSGNMVHAFDVSFSDVRVETSRLVLADVVSDMGLPYALYRCGMIVRSSSRQVRLEV